MNRFFTFVSVVALLGLAAIPSSATVIFGNITQAAVAALDVEGSKYVFNGAQSVAAAFTPSASATMNQAQVYVQRASISGSGPYVDLYLYSDNGGAPGSSVETLATDVSAPTTLGTVPLTGFAPIALTAGMQYWLVMTPYDANTLVGWFSPGTPAVQTDYAENSTGTPPWIATGFSVQFEIDGTLTPSIPEPGIAGLTVLGLGALLLTKRRSFRNR